MSFTEYLMATKDRKPSWLLEEALPYVKDGKAALDLGAGALNDARFLISEGYTVDAVDSEPSFVEYDKDSSINCIVSTFADFAFPAEQYDLVNAQYSLPFNPPETFDDVFVRLTSSLKKGGVFVGQFFGTEDGWSDRPHMTFLTREKIETVLAPYTLQTFIEKKGLRPTAAGPEKFWHTFDVIASKKDM